MAKSTISMAMPKADGLPVLQVGSSGTSALTRCEQLRRDMETIVTMEKPWENYGKTIRKDDEDNDKDTHESHDDCDDGSKGCLSQSIFAETIVQDLQESASTWMNHPQAVRMGLKCGPCLAQKAPTPAPRFFHTWKPSAR